MSESSPTESYDLGPDPDEQVPASRPVPQTPQPVPPVWSPPALPPTPRIPAPPTSPPPVVPTWSGPDAQPDRSAGSTTLDSRDVLEDQVRDLIADQRPAGPGHAPVVQPGETGPVPAQVPIVDPRGPGAAKATNQVELTEIVEVREGRPAIERLLTGLVVAGGSDMHLYHGQPPWYRVNGALLPVAAEPALSSTDIEAMLRVIASPRQWEEFSQNNDLDFAYAMRQDEGAALTTRFRCNVMRALNETGAVMRVIPTKITGLDELGILPQVKSLASRPRGLVLFCGPTGSGKLLGLSTTIPTPSGHTTMGDLEVGSEVLGRDGSPCLVTGLSPIVETPDLYRVTFSDGQQVLADGQHQWVVADHHGRSVPRTRKREKAIARYRDAHLDADAIEALGGSLPVQGNSTATEIHAQLISARLHGEFPSVGSVENALRITDCPRHPSSRPSVARTERHEVGPWLYLVSEVLTGVVEGGGPRAGLAEDLLESGRHPERGSTLEIARLLGAENHSVARSVVDRRGLKGVPTRVDVIDRGAKQAAVVEYPTEIALKSLALRLRQRFGMMPLDRPELHRLETAEMLERGLRLAQGHANFAVPVTSALDLPQAELPVDPYVFGAWLGDGATGAGAFTSGAVESCTNADGSTDQDRLVATLADAGYPAKVGRNGKTVYVTGLRGDLRAAGAFTRKHIPTTYLRASAAQRLAVLQGLMDTDGTADATGCCELSLSDKTLATDALELIRSLGIKASVSWDQPASYRDEAGELVVCKDRHRIHFTTDQQVFRLPRKAARLLDPATGMPRTLRETATWLYITGIEKLHHDDPEYGPARCITVDSPDHTYLCGDGFVVTSNSTSMAGLVDLINTTRHDRIFTLEDPVEFTHVSKSCLVSHREIGEDTASFEEGLRRVRREDPDVILIGEMRDYHTIAAAIEAADTGHLVIATLHTNSAPETISRIINSFPGTQQDQIRITLASTLLAVICQTLVASPKSTRGRVVAQEIMMVSPGIANNIRENDIPAIASALTDTTGGSISLDAHLAELVRQNIISRKSAYEKAHSPENLDRYLSAETA